MALEIISQSFNFDLRGQFIFLSAGIPEPEYAEQEYEPLEITEAVLAATRSILSANGRLLFGAHPAISPLVLRVVRDFEPLGETPRIIVYQSELYLNQIPEATLRLQQPGLGELRFVAAEPGETPVPGHNTESLGNMRTAMIGDNDPIAAIFIGGKSGISDEFHQFITSPTRHRHRPTYIFGFPGGVARQLAFEELDRFESYPADSRNQARYELSSFLAQSNDYYSIMDAVQQDLKRWHRD